MAVRDISMQENPAGFSASNGGGEAAGYERSAALWQRWDRLLRLRHGTRFSRCAAAVER